MEEEKDDITRICDELCDIALDVIELRRSVDSERLPMSLVKGLEAIQSYCEVTLGLALAVQDGVDISLGGALDPRDIGR